VTRAFLPAALVAALALAGCPAAAAPPEPAPEDAPPASPEERRYDELVHALETRAAARHARAGGPDVAAIEADEIARVAEELLAEGDADLAVMLLEEALALLPEATDAS
jgi:hypothetical protein